MRGRPATPSAPHSSMSTPSGKPDVFSRHRSAKSSGNVQVKVLSPQMPGPEPRKRVPACKGQTGKQDGCGTVGVSGNALRESGQGRQFGSVRHQREGRLVRLFDDRATAVETEPTLSFHPSAGPEKARAEIRRRTGSGRDPPARAKGRPGTDCGNTGRRQSRAGRDMASSTTRNTRCISNTGSGKGRHQSSPRTSVKKSTRVGSTAAASSRTRRARSASSAGSSSRSRGSA